MREERLKILDINFFCVVQPNYFVIKCAKKIYWWKNNNLVLKIINEIASNGIWLSKFYFNPYHCLFSMSIVYVYIIRSNYPNINLGTIIFFSLENFRGCIRRRPAPSGQLFSGREIITESKVGDFDVHVGIE